MINISEVLETNKMIEQENLDVRTITMGINLLNCADSDLQVTCDNIYKKITTLANNLVSTGEAISREFAIPIVNKRISITLTLSFFLRNGYIYLVKDFMEEIEAIGYHVAAGHIDRDLLTEVMRCIVNDEDYSESIKLELIEAMSQGIDFSDDE